MHYLIPRVLTTYSIMEVSKYYFDMAYIAVSPKHVKLTFQEKDNRVVAGLDAIEKPFKVVNIQ